MPMKTDASSVKSLPFATRSKRAANIRPRRVAISCTLSSGVPGHSIVHFLSVSENSRTWLYYKLKGLDGVVTLINAGRPDLTATGWDIAEGIDHVNGFRNTKEIYLRANPEYKNRYTVPILWDQKLQTIGISSRTRN
jgi:Glutathione S-transferase, N-terminal domain